MSGQTIMKVYMKSDQDTLRKAVHEREKTHGRASQLFSIDRMN